MITLSQKFKSRVASKRVRATYDTTLTPSFLTLQEMTAYKMGHIHIALAQQQQVEEEPEEFEAEAEYDGETATA